MKLDIVIPIWNEKENIRELCTRLGAACRQVPDAQWRVIFVNDGSVDASPGLIREYALKEPRFALVDLSRNFGHQAAISAGLAQADGDAVVIMDGDLQDPPELIPELVAAWRKGGQIVRAERRSRQETGLRRAGFDFFHGFFHWISDYPIPPNAGVFGLLDKRAVEEINRLPEKSRFLPGLRAWIGFEQRVVLYDRDERAAGEPKQTFARLIRYALDGVFSFSYKPLRIMTWFGLMVSGIGFVMACWFIFKRLIGKETADTGFTTTITMVLFMGGIQLIALGMLGEYVGRIYEEVKRRPLYIIKDAQGLGPRSAVAEAVAEAPPAATAQAVREEEPTAIDLEPAKGEDERQPG